MNFSSGIKIDEVAAKADISRINQEIPELQAPRAALVRVKEQGEATKGQTGKAIVEKANALINRIDKLIRSLRETSAEINVTVQQNQILDANIASFINNVG